MQKSYLFLKNPPQQILQQSKQLFVKSYEHIKIAYKKFYQNLTKSPTSTPSSCTPLQKQQILSKISTFSNIEQLIIIDLMIGCENVDMCQVGKLVMKMHLQYMEIIKWIIVNVAEGRNKSVEEDANALRREAIRQYEKEMKMKKQRDKSTENYYRLKQASLFAVFGLQNQLSQIQSSLNNQHLDHNLQIERILDKKSQIQRLQPSGNEQILHEAVDIITHHSQIFQKLTMDNKSIINANTTAFNSFKNYNKLKGQIQESMKDKIHVANQKLCGVVDRYFGKKNQGDRNRNDRKEYGMQVGATSAAEDKRILEERRKDEKLKQLTDTLLFQKLKAQNIQKCLKQKVSSYQQKLQKLKNDRTKEAQIRILKKSITELTSLHKLRSQLEQQYPQLGSSSYCPSGLASPHQKQRQLQEVLGIFMPKKCINAAKIQKKRKMVLDRKEQKQYLKSLKRIHLSRKNSGDPNGGNTEGDEEHEELYSIKFSNCGLELCNDQINVCYDPLTNKHINDCHSPYYEGYRTLVRKRLGIFTNLYQISSVIVSQKQRNRNASLITIKNMKNNLSSKDQKSPLSIISHPQTPALPKRTYTTQRDMKFKLLKQSRLNPKQKKLKSQHQVVILEPNKDCIEFGKRYGSGVGTANGNLDIRDQLRKFQLGKGKTEDTFELINFDDDAYTKNKGRLKAMMTQLKKKRYNRQNTTSNHKPQKPSTTLPSPPTLTTLLQPPNILSLYISQQNAMQAELQQGITKAIYIAERKTAKQLRSSKADEQNQHEKEIRELTELSKKLYSAIKQIYRNYNGLYYQILYVIKHPFTIIKNNGGADWWSGAAGGRFQREELGEEEVFGFVRFMTKLHTNCQYQRAGLDTIKDKNGDLLAIENASENKQNIQNSNMGVAKINSQNFQKRDKKFCGHIKQFFDKMGVRL